MNFCLSVCLYDEIVKAIIADKIVISHNFKRFECIIRLTKNLALILRFPIFNELLIRQKRLFLNTLLNICPKLY